MAGMELVDARYVDYSKLDTPTLIADDFFDAGCVLGPEVTDWRRIDLGALGGVTTINGSEAGRGRSGDVMGHPFEALAWLASLMSQRGHGLRAGEFIFTGSVVETKWWRQATTSSWTSSVSVGWRPLSPPDFLRGPSPTGAQRACCRANHQQESIHDRSHVVRLRAICNVARRERGRRHQSVGRCRRPHHVFRQPAEAGRHEVRQARNQRGGPYCAARTERRRGPGERVRLYTTTWCGYCKKARAYLRSRNIPFDDIDVETTDRGRREYREIGGNGVPVIFVGERRMDGYDQAGCGTCSRPRAGSAFSGAR